MVSTVESGVKRLNGMSRDLFDETLNERTRVFDETYVV